MNILDYILPNSRANAESLAKEALFQAKIEQNKLRRENMQKRIDYYHGNQKAHLLQAIKRQFKYPNRLNLQYEFFNLTAMIIDELAAIYKEEPKREIVNGTDRDKEIYDAIQESSSINLVLTTVNRYTKLCKTCMVRPVFRGGVIEYDIFTPNIFDVVQDPFNPTRAIAIIYTQATTDTDPVSLKYFGNTGASPQDDMMINGQMYYYWDAKNHVVFTYDVKKTSLIPIIKEQLGNEGNINPYGVLPFVVFRDAFPIDRFFIDGGDDLINSNEITNVKKTELNYLTKMQSFSIPVMKGAPKDMVFEADPSSVITIPADGDNNTGNDFKFVSPDPKIKDLSEDIQSRLVQTAIRYKLPGEMFTMSGERSGGFSIQMQQERTNKTIDADKPLYSRYEQELFNMTRLVWNYHNPDNKISDECFLRVKFRVEETAQTQEERDNHSIIEYANGLISKARWVMRSNPTITTIDEAMGYLRIIEDERREEMSFQIEKQREAGIDANIEGN